jgi:hypothetical protein
VGDPPTTSNLRLAALFQALAEDSAG